MWIIYGFYWIKFISATKHKEVFKFKWKEPGGINMYFMCVTIMQIDNEIKSESVVCVYVSECVIGTFKWVTFIIGIRAIMVS